ncbi:hypothetical protein, partial [Tistrella bauzanensis]|uniref:hypothetical protein n=1 Tax=Tistrella bauzanensis TaxID=657419 RepID=UPI001E36104A
PSQAKKVDNERFRLFPPCHAQFHPIALDAAPPGLDGAVFGRQTATHVQVNRLCLVYVLLVEPFRGGQSNGCADLTGRSTRPRYRRPPSETKAAVLHVRATFRTSRWRPVDDRNPTDPAMIAGLPKDDPTDVCPT